MSGSGERRDVAGMVSEGINCLGVLLCRGAFRKVKAEAPAILLQWETEFAPLFRKLDLAGAHGVALRSALGRISAIAGATLDPDSAEQVAQLRSAVRDALGAMRLPVPAPSSPGAAVCELHGEQCPFGAEAAE